jgi:hypothetical protein
MAAYGPEAHEARKLLRETVTNRIHDIWQEDSAGTVDINAARQGPGADTLQRILLDLSPLTEAQRFLKPTMLQIIGEIAKARELVIMDTGKTIQWPFLAMLVFWLTLIFTSFGLFAPPNGTVIAALFLSSLTVAGSIYLIVQMDQPYTGLIKISNEPIRSALGQLSQ